VGPWQYGLGGDGNWDGALTYVGLFGSIEAYRRGVPAWATKCSRHCYAPWDFGVAHQQGTPDQ
jgi:hypothetical protein